MLQVLTLALFIVAALLFLLAAIGVKTTTNLTGWGLLALTLGLALKLGVFGP